MQNESNKLSDRNHRPESIPECWGVMTFYERFEHIIVLILSFIISLVVIFALIQLIQKIYVLLILGVFNPVDHHIFQVIFGMIMTLLIAMEFKHSILKVLERNAQIVQAQGVILIALLALSRKLIIINLETTEPLKLMALSFSILVLVGVYWALNRQDKTRRD